MSILIKDRLRNANGNGTPADEPTVELEFITPEIAAEYLAANTRNRKLRERRLTGMVGDMIEGRWKLSTNAITFDRDGVLLNGQHTLTAIVQSGMAQRLIVCRNWPTEAQDVMDSGAARTFSDALRIAGVSNYNTVAASTRSVYAYRVNGVLCGTAQLKRPTNAQLHQELAAHPLLPSIVPHKSPFPGLNAGMYGGALYLFSRANADDAVEFDRLMRTGDGLNVGHPIHTLRDRIMRDQAAVHSQLRASVKSVFLVRTWNAWRGGESLVKLQFNPGGARPDRHPLIDGCPIVPEVER